jgi:hypothetical protein
MAKYSLAGAKTDNYNKNRPNAGVYLCEIVNIRAGSDRFSGTKRTGWHLDAKIVECLEKKFYPSDIQKLRVNKDTVKNVAQYAGDETPPSPAGMEFHQPWYPQNAQAAGGLSQEDVELKELGKVRTMLAAAMGYSGADGEFLSDEETGEAIVESIVAALDSDEKSPLAGRLIVVEYDYYCSKKNKQAGNGEYGLGCAIFPAENQEPLPKAVVENTAPVKAPKAPARPPTATPKPTPAAKPAFPPAGWTKHPESTDEATFYENGDGEVLTEDELRATI